MSENPQYGNTGSISPLAPIDKDLGSQQQLDETTDAQPLTETKNIGSQPTGNNRAVASILKKDIGPQKAGNRDIGSQGNANRVYSAKSRGDSSQVKELFRSRKRKHADNLNALNPPALKGLLLTHTLL